MRVKNTAGMPFSVTLRPSFRVVPVPADGNWVELPDEYALCDECVALVGKKWLEVEVLSPPEPAPAKAPEPKPEPESVVEEKPKPKKRRRKKEEEAPPEEPPAEEG